MNDEFLYRLRRQPPADLAARLKAKLDRQRPGEAPRKRGVSYFAVMALLIGGSAFAWVSPAVRTTVLEFFAEWRAEKVQPIKPITVTSVTKPQEASPPPRQTSWMWGDSNSHSAAAAAPAPPPAAKRGQLVIVSSWPYVALPSSMSNEFSRGSPLQGPRLQRAADGDAFRLLCDGAGMRYPDAALVFRRIAPSELAACESNRAMPITELKLAYEALVPVRSVDRAPLPLTLRDIYLALAREVPDPGEPTRFIPNPYSTWRQINPALPDEKIEFVGPASASAGYESFAQLILEAGCETFRQSRALQSSDFVRYLSLCRTHREDGVYVESNDSDSLVHRVANRPGAIGILSYHRFQQNSAKLAASTLDGVAATYESIETGRYRASRALYVYGKKSHFGLAPELARFLQAYASERVIGPDGYLAHRGLVPLSDNERAKSRRDAAALKSFQTTTVTGR